MLCSLMHSCDPNLADPHPNDTGYALIAPLLWTASSYDRIDLQPYGGDSRSVRRVELAESPMTCPSSSMARKTKTSRRTRPVDPGEARAYDRHTRCCCA